MAKISSPLCTSSTSSSPTWPRSLPSTKSVSATPRVRSGPCGVFCSCAIAILLLSLDHTEKLPAKLGVVTMTVPSRPLDADGGERFPGVLRGVQGLQGSKDRWPVSAVPIPTPALIVPARSMVRAFYRDAQWSCPNVLVSPTDREMRPEAPPQQIRA